MIKTSMLWKTISCGALLLYGTASAAHSETPLRSWTVSALEQRVEQIDSELDQLARSSLRGGVGSNGFRSEPHETAENTEWVEIDLGPETDIDEIVLVPTLIRDSRGGFQAEGFPLRFRVIAGTAADRNGEVIASFTEQDKLLPRIAPVVIPCTGTTASWIRVEADRLSPRGIDGKYTLQFAEILAFSGFRNTALRRPVSHPEHKFTDTGPWLTRFLTDGSVPYLMDAAEEDKSIAFLGRIPGPERPSLMLDLGEVRSISQVSLHAIDQSDTIPQGHFGNTGIPRHFIIEGSDSDAFSNPIVLLEVEFPTFYDIAPIMSWNIPETACRFVRFSPLESELDSWLEARPTLGFAEIELFENGVNAAAGAPVSAGNLIVYPDRPFALLTDGMNYYGRILPVRDWLNQLARRHNLEAERPRLQHELNSRYARQKTYLRIVSWLAALLAGGTVITILAEKIIRQRAVFRTRERIAANLHDELGANLHAIGLFGDLAKHEIDQLETREQFDKVINYLDEVRSLTKETGATARYCTNLLEASEHFEDIGSEMRRLSERLLADLQHTFSINAEEQLGSMRMRRRIDLYLFYKECLTNIVRHSGATEVSTRTDVRGRNIELTVSDNGCGVGDIVPASLKRRARLLSGKFSVSAPDSGGTCIHLKLRVKHYCSGKDHAHHH